MNAYGGEAACLAAAALWSIAVALFREPIERHGARVVNLAKCALALVLLTLTAAVAGRLGEFSGASSRDLALIAISGVVGLTVGDTALFAAVARIGPYRALLFQTLTPAFTAAMAFAWLGRVPGPWQAAGAVVTLTGVVLVLLSGRAGERSTVGDRSAVPWIGIALAVGAAAGQGAGIVLAKEGMTTVSAMPAAVLRLAAATFGLALVMAGRVPVSTLASSLVRRGNGLSRIVAGTVLGTYLAFFLMMVGIARAPETVAAVLLSTTPVFGLFVEAALGRERITPRSLAGTALAIAGVVTLSLGVGGI